MALVTNEYLTENSNLNNSTEMNELSPISSTATETDALAHVVLEDIMRHAEAIVLVAMEALMHL